MTDCLICRSPVEDIISFGQMPIANSFLLPGDFDNEYLFNLKVGFCPKCTMVQLMELVEQEKMFHENYAYFSSFSTHMDRHFESFAETVKKRYMGSVNPFVVEIGSNDGIMLKHFLNEKIRHLGVEPSANVAHAAIAKGINTLCSFFDLDVARKIREKYGPADVILGTNVMCHIPYLHSIVEGIELLLKPKGVLIFEDPYLGDIIEKTSYDQIYDEHVFYFSISSVAYLFDQHGFELVDIEPQNIHGGSMRFTISRKGCWPLSPNVVKQQVRENALGLDQFTAFDKFCERIEHSRDAFMRLLKNLKSEKKRITGYGATSKSTTILNYCGIGPDLIDYISDTTPNKQGKFTPGMHIPVKPYEEFMINYPDYAVLFAWNHGKEVIAKEEKFLEQGGRFIGYVPSVRIIT